MDEVWQRIDSELKARKKSWAWLYNELGYNRARVHNWKARGVPRAEFASIAVAMGESVDWVAGLGEPKRRSDGPLPPMATRLAREFAAIKDPQRQLDAYTECLNVIVRARGI